MLAVLLHLIAMHVCIASDKKSYKNVDSEKVKSTFLKPHDLRSAAEVTERIFAKGILGNQIMFRSVKTISDMKSFLTPFN